MQNQFIFSWFLASVIGHCEYISGFQGNSGALILQHGQYLQQVAVPIESSCSFPTLLLFWQKKFINSCFIWEQSVSKNCALYSTWTQHGAQACRGWGVTVFPPHSCLEQLSLCWSLQRCLCLCAMIFNETRPVVFIDKVITPWSYSYPQFYLIDNQYQFCSLESNFIEVSQRELKID